MGVPEGLGGTMIETTPSDPNTPHLGVFAAFVQGERDQPFEVYLINDSQQDYARALLYMGAFAGLDDEGVIETSRAVQDFALPAGSAQLIDSADAWALDFVSWYHVDLYARPDMEPQRVWFRVPKYVSQLGPIVRLPVLAVEGRAIRLQPREGGQSVEDEIRAAEAEGWRRE
jgi:hypothetical protein